MPDIAPASPAPREPWKPPFLNLPVHAVIRHQLTLALDGVESSLIVGPRGAGKTEAIQRFVTELRKSELLRNRDGGPRPREILYYATATATGPKTVLTDVYCQLTGQTLGKRSKQDWTPTQFIAQIVNWAREHNVTLIIVDEAQHVSANNIDHLRQLCDKADDERHPLRVVLIGNEGLTQEVSATGQLGERFATEVRVPPFAPGDVAPYIPQFHPDIPGIQRNLGAKEWRKRENKLLLAAGGSFRRLTLIIANADELARLRGTPMTAEDLDRAIEKIAPLL